MKSEEKWAEELAALKSIIEKTNLIPIIKWGWDIYTHKGRNVVSYGGFKNFFSLWFYDGVFLKDPHKVLHAASEGKTKALRQWRFTSIDEINEKAILAYIQEAIKNVEEGNVWTPEKAGRIEIPEVMNSFFKKEKELKIAFKKLSPYKQKEYIEYIYSAKRVETKATRLEKTKPMILQGIGLHDKYRGH